MRRDHLELHLRYERTNWWFIARQRILLDVMSRLIPGLTAASGGSGTQRGDAGRGPMRLLDIGCGGGGFVQAMGRFGEAIGLDADPDAVAFARGRGLDVRLGRLPDNVPLQSGTFDVVTLLDVIEHVDDHARAVETARRLLVPGGFLVCTVPAYQFLWSYHDEVNEHKRRYTRPGLRQLLSEGGFRIHKISYFNSILFPPIAAVRSLRRLIGGRGRADSPVVPASVNALLTGVFGLERLMLRWASFPFGVSILAVAQSPASTAGENLEASPLRRAL